MSRAGKGGDVGCVERAEDVATINRDERRDFSRRRAENSLEVETRKMERRGRRRDDGVTTARIIVQFRLGFERFATVASRRSLGFTLWGIFRFFRRIWSQVVVVIGVEEEERKHPQETSHAYACLLYTSPSPRDS